MKFLQQQHKKIKATTNYLFIFHRYRALMHNYSYMYGINIKCLLQWAETGL